MIRWLSNQQRKISSLRLSGAYKKRLSAPHVLALAKSIVETAGAINLPAIHGKTKELAAGEDRVAALQLAACFKKTNPTATDAERWELAVVMALEGKGADTTIELRAFDGDEQDIRKVRAMENAHRRHDDRDKWLASLAAGREDNDYPIEQESSAGQEADVHPSPGATAGGDGKGKAAPGPIPAQAPPSALYPPDNVAQGFAQLCICGHTQEQHGDFGDPNCTECTCEMFEVESAEQFMCNVDCGGTPCGHPVGESGICAGGHDWTPAGVFKGARLIGMQNVYEQQAGRPPVPSQPVTVEGPKEKAKRRKEAAELATAVTGKPVTPAAVKQAEYRERKKDGKVNPRKAHDDSGEPLGEAGLEVQKSLYQVDRCLKEAAGLLTGLLSRHPELADRFPFDGIIARLKDVAKEARACHPVAPCVYCLAAVKKDPRASCNACRGQRWSTKAEVETAPAELRKAAGA